MIYQPDESHYGDEDDRFFFQPGGDTCPHCGSTNTERIDTVSDDPTIWACQCGKCAETFEVLIELGDEGDDHELPLCEACHGTGHDWDLMPCNMCDGEGYKWWL